MTLVQTLKIMPSLTENYRDETKSEVYDCWTSLPLRVNTSMVLQQKWKSNEISELLVFLLPEEHSDSRFLIMDAPVATILRDSAFWNVRVKETQMADCNTRCILNAVPERRELQTFQLSNWTCAFWSHYFDLIQFGIAKETGQLGTHLHNHYHLNIV